MPRRNRRTDTETKGRPKRRTWAYNEGAHGPRPDPNACEYCVLGECYVHDGGWRENV